MTNEHRINVLEEELKELRNNFNKEIKDINLSIGKVHTLIEGMNATDRTWKTTRCDDHERVLTLMRDELHVLDTKIRDRWPVVIAAAASSVVATMASVGIVLTLIGH